MLAVCLNLSQGTKNQLVQLPWQVVLGAGRVEILKYVEHFSVFNHTLYQAGQKVIFETAGALLLLHTLYHCIMLL